MLLPHWIGQPVVQVTLHDALALSHVVKQPPRPMQSTVHIVLPDAQLVMQPPPPQVTLQ